MSDHYKQEEISDEDDDYVQSPKKEQAPKQPQLDEKVEVEAPVEEDPVEQEHEVVGRMSEPSGKMESPPKKLIDHEQIGQYANITMELEEQESASVRLKIVGVQTKGSALSKYTVYIIKGVDKNGDINVCRRFSEFHALRTALVKRWPGCFIPSIPDKKFVNKNDKEEVEKRERYLNDFLHKIAHIPHLYNSEEFQAFIKSKEQDVSNLFSSWANCSYENIIHKYRECFGELAGKEINEQTNDTITQFYSKIKKNQSLYDKYRAQAKALAISKDRFNQTFPKLFSQILPTYEKTLLAEYVEGNEDKMVYLNSDEVKLGEQASMAADVCQKNPYWILYDLLKHEERDGLAFMESFSAIETLENKKHAMESKIKDNEKAILELGDGKKNMKSMTSKGSNEEIKYKLEVETEELKKQKDFLWTLIDIISALIVFIEIPAYQEGKAKFYENTLRKIGGYEINAVQISAEIWSNTAQSCCKIAQRQLSNVSL